MDYLAKKFQEVSDLTNTETPEGATQESTSAPSASTAIDRSSATREELLDALTAAEASHDKSQKQWESLKGESEQLQDEYSAYKQRVATWREQMKTNRGQDRKTIEMLRKEVATLKGGGDVVASADGATPRSSAPVDDTYTSSLEQQVKSLKETVRDYGNERDALELENQRLKSKLRAAEIAAASGGANGDDEEAGEGEDRAKLVVQAARADELGDRNNKLEKQVATLEQSVEQLTKEAADAEAQVLSLMQQHRAELKAAEVMHAKDKQLQYIKELEKELQQWRKRGLNEATSSTMQQGDGSGSAADLADVGAGAADAAPDLTDGAAQQISSPSPSHDPATQLFPPARGRIGGDMLGTISQLEGTVSLLNERIAERDAAVVALEGELLSVREEKEAQDASINALFDEQKSLQEAAEKAHESLQAAIEAQHAVEQQAAELEADVATEREAKLAASEAESAAVKNSNRLQTQLAERNEQLRKMKQEIARHAAAKTAAAPADASAGAEAGAASVAVSGLDAGSTSQSSAAQNLGFNFSSTTFSANSLNMEQAKAMWQRFAGQRQKVFTAQKFRMYVAIAVLTILTLMFAFHQSSSITDDDDLLRQQLAGCRQEVREMKRVVSRAVGGPPQAPSP